MANEPNQGDFGNGKTTVPRSRTTILIVSSIALFAVGVLSLFIVILLWYIDPENKLSIADRSEFLRGFAAVIQAIAVLVAGVIGLAGLYFTRETLRQDRKRTQRTIELTEEGQITDRFTRAIDQLGKTDTDGDPQLETRLGGIYALEQIARESEIYRDSIMEVLTAYVRVNSPRHTSNEEASRVSSDIQAILTVLGRRTLHSKSGKIERINLRNTNLRGVQLMDKANLTGADLVGADLSGVKLPKVILEEADLTAANLTGAKLSGANLQGATLREAKFIGAYLGYAYFKGADLTDADFTGADRWGAHDFRVD